MPRPTASSALISANALWGLIALAAVVALTMLFAKPEGLIRTTIHLALIEYAIALWLMMSMTLPDWEAQTTTGRFARHAWTWSCITLLIHVACAFHFTHHWSQARALEQTRRESGFAEGLYVNYALIALWIADSAWWQLAPNSYARRHRGIDRALHGFMFFIAFNATVVFETGPVRYAGLIATLLLASRFSSRLIRPRPA